MDALKFLRAEHDSVLEMLEALDGAPHDSGLGAMVTPLVIAESQHEAIEEQWFWPAVRNHLADGDELADHATAQEQAGKVLLQRLEDGTPGDSDYHEALQEFIKAGREHIAYEQDVVWPRLAAALSPAELDRLGDRLAIAKKVAPTRPHPATPPVGMVLKTMGLGVAVMDRVRDAVTGRSALYPPDPPSH